MKSVLQSNIILAEKAATVLQESYESVSIILAKGDNYSLNRQERESYEALTARFSRFSDILIQKVFRSLDEAKESLKEVFQFTPTLIQSLSALKEYCQNKKM